MILHGGVYTQTCRRAITANGTPANPITIRAADGETSIVTRPVPVNFRYDQNNVEIVNSSYLIIKGLRFKGGDVILANNAIYCPGGAAVNGSGLTGSGLTISSNYFEGALSGAAADSSRFVGGGTAAAAFAGPAELDFSPPAGSILIGKATQSSRRPSILTSARV